MENESNIFPFPSSEHLKAIEIASWNQTVDKVNYVLDRSPDWLLDEAGLIVRQTDSKLFWKDLLNLTVNSTRQYLKEVKYLRRRRI